MDDYSVVAASVIIVSTFVLCGGGYMFLKYQPKPKPEPGGDARPTVGRPKLRFDAQSDIEAIV